MCCSGHGPDFTLLQHYHTAKCLSRILIKQKISTLIVNYSTYMLVVIHKNSDNAIKHLIQELSPAETEQTHNKKLTLQTPALLVLPQRRVHTRYDESQKILRRNANMML